MAVDCRKNAQWSGQENISVYLSSSWAERGFCRQCGTNLFYRFKSTGDELIPAGLFDDESQLKLKREVFVEQRAPGYAYANDTHKISSHELQALHGALATESTPDVKESPQNPQ